MERVGGWDIWYSDWDEKTNDWGVAYNMGPVINNSHPDDQMYLYEVSKDTVFCLAYGSTDLFSWNYQTNNWVKIDSFWYHNLGIGDVDGISLPSSHKKIYYGGALITIHLNFGTMAIFLSPIGIAQRIIGVIR